MQGQGRDGHHAMLQAPEGTFQHHMDDEVAMSYRKMLSWGAAAVATLVVVAGCERRERAVTNDESGQLSDVAPETVTSQDTAKLTNANIVALLDQANESDSAAAAYALTKATHPEVKDFAKLMMGEHHALRVQGQRLAKQLGITPEPPADDPVEVDAKSEMVALKAAPKGPEFDKTYIDQEVKIHRSVITLAQQAHSTTQQPQLRTLIEQALPILQNHLVRAQKIQQTLEKTTT